VSAVITYSRQEQDRLRVALATVQAENRRLRRMTQNGKAGRILHRAAADARQIVAWRWAGYSVTRRKCESYGMGQYRWAWAMALLRVAGVAPYPGDTDNFLVEDLDDATARIDQAVRMTEQAGDLSRLRGRMYRRRKG
jgi:hypothetical protein